MPEPRISSMYIFDKIKYCCSLKETKTRGKVIFLTMGRQTAIDDLYFTDRHVYYESAGNKIIACVGG